MSSRLSSNLEHSVEGNTSPVFYVVAYFDLVDHATIHQVFKRPRQMLRRDSIHSGAEAASVVECDDALAFGGKLARHAIHQVDLSTDSEHAAGGSVADQLDKPFG